MTQSNGKDSHYFPECFDKCDGVPGDCRNCDLQERICEALAAYENTGMTPEQITAMKNTSVINQINLYSTAFAEAEEQLNAELSEAIRILKKSPMFEGRVTIAIVISNEGNSVRPILYKTKYTPRQYNSEERAYNLPGQLTFEEE